MSPAAHLLAASLILISLAGPASNFLLATLAAVTLALIPAGDARSLSAFLQPLLVTALFVNVYLGVFNLIPFPPLDGSKVLSTFLPPGFQPIFDMLEQYGFLILMLLVYMGVIGLVMYPFYVFVEYLLYTRWF